MKIKKIKIMIIQIKNKIKLSWKIKIFSLNKMILKMIKNILKNTLKIKIKLRTNSETQADFLLYKLLQKIKENYANKFQK